MSEEIKDIRVVPESECCGCAACANAGPVDAVSARPECNTVQPVKRM